jgi:purine-nucleoside phosphorylase
MHVEGGVGAAGAPRGAGTVDHQVTPFDPVGLARTILAETGGSSSDLAVVLGSGLGGLADRVERHWERFGRELPGYPVSTVVGHAGRLILGSLSGRAVWVVQGRVHIYEGYTPEEVTRYVRLLHALGVRTLVLTNAAGSIDSTAAAPGDVVLCRDAVNLFFRCLARPARDLPWRSRGPLSTPALCLLAAETAREAGICLRPGVLAASSGPSYESAAEVRAWRLLGGTVASMSTVPEALAARELGMRRLVFSLATNLGTGLSSQPLTHEDVVHEADRAGATLQRLLEILLPRL